MGYPSKFPGIFAGLAAPFARNEVKERSGKGSQKFRYISARTAMNRLDSVVGPENWTDDYFPTPKGVVCKLTIVMPDGSTITKCDVGGFAGMSDQGDDEKSGFSDAFKRAAIKFGIGRYLYGDGVPQWIRDYLNAEKQQRSEPAATPTPAALPAPAPAPAPAPEPQPEPQASNEPSPDAPPWDNAKYGCPLTGRALFARIKDFEQQFRVSVLHYINSHERCKGFPRIGDCTPEQMSIVYYTAIECLRANRVLVFDNIPENYWDEWFKKANAPALPNAPAQRSEPDQIKQNLLKMARKAARAEGSENPPVAELIAIVNGWAEDHLNGEVIDNFHTFDDLAALRKLENDVTLAMAAVQR